MSENNPQRQRQPILHVSVVNGQNEIQLDPGIWEDPAAWGILISDIVKHLSIAIEQRGGGSAADNFERILEGLRAELSDKAENA